MSLTRTHSFASPATHKRIEVEIDFPIQGVGQAGLTPLNLRYTSGTRTQDHTLNVSNQNMGGIKSSKEEEEGEEQEEEDGEGEEDGG